MEPLIIEYQEHSPAINETAYVAANAVIIGNVEIGAGSSVWFNCVLRGDVNFIRVGDYTNIQDGTVVHVGSATESNPKGNPTVIGNHVTIGHMALIHACTICDRALIGMKACVMDGAVVEEGAIVGAGSVVPAGKVIPRNQLWIGAPARFVRELGDNDVERLKWMNDVYVGLTPEYKKIDNA